jgi:hypothetical protein
MLLAAALGAALVSGPAPAQTAGTAAGVKDRVDFNKLVQQRNRLHAKLLALDEQATRRMLNGEKPLSVHADQVSVQDQLDLVELRLTILATRHGFDVPPLPGRDPGGDSATDLDGASNDKIEGAFARGRDRALDKVREEARQLLASLDFGAFLAE